MKAKKYVEKYKLLDQKLGQRSNEFLADLDQDFEELLAKNGGSSPKGFENAVNALRQKFDGVVKKARYAPEEKLWGYYYATHIIPLKKELYPEYVKAMEEKRQREKQIRDRHRRQEQEEYNIFR